MLRSSKRNFYIRFYGLINNRIIRDNIKLRRNSTSFNKYIIYLIRHYWIVTVCRSSLNITSLTLVSQLKSALLKNLHELTEQFWYLEKDNRNCNSLVYNLQNNNSLLWIFIYRLSSLTSAGLPHIRRWLKLGNLPIYNSKVVLEQICSELHLI